MDTSIIRTWLRLLRLAAIAIGVLLSFFAFIEILRAYVFLREFSPWLAAGFVAVLVVGTLWLGGHFFWTLWRLPRAMSPPVVADPERLTAREVAACSRYLQHRIEQLRRNPRFAPGDLGTFEHLLGRLRSSPDAAVVGDCEQELNRTLAPLDEDAERLVQQCVRDVSTAVVLSPFRSVDLLIVLYRNGQMILQLAKHYQTRPAATEELRILKDVLAIVATVNLLNFTEKFLEQMLASVPVVGSLAGDLSQGVGAGLLTSATGHAAIQRCRSVAPWDRGSAQQALVNRMPRFARDVKEIVRADILPRLRTQLPDFAGASDKIATAFENALNGMNTWIWRPVTTGGTALAGATTRGGETAWRAASGGVASLARATSRGGETAWRAAREGASTLAHAAKRGGRQTWGKARAGIDALLRRKS
jgi:uncharacterized membrane protein YcjF (UPF0283 family)